MSKYEPLWKYVVSNSSKALELPFSRVKDILGFDIDHAFLTYKKEIEAMGYQVKISMKNQVVSFKKA
ncbi:MAG: hypothetical protein Q4E33_00250 [Erysipelotrichaceae bacterium]|nr:hypothetical protein [Erysipelotrichaceae bacterium]